MDKQGNYFPLGTKKSESPLLVPWQSSLDTACHTFSSSLEFTVYLPFLSENINFRIMLPKDNLETDTF